MDDNPYRSPESIAAHLERQRAHVEAVQLFAAIMSGMMSIGWFWICRIGSRVPGSSELVQWAAFYGIMGLFLPGMVVCRLIYRRLRK